MIGLFDGGKGFKMSGQRSVCDIIRPGVLCRNDESLWILLRRWFPAAYAHQGVDFNRPGVVLVLYFQHRRSFQVFEDSMYDTSLCIVHRHFSIPHSVSRKWKISFQMPRQDPRPSLTKTSAEKRTSLTCD